MLSLLDRPKMRWALAAAFCLLAGARAPAEDAEAYSRSTVYAKVDGRPITGEDVADFIARERWDDAMELYVERELTLGAVAEAKIDIPPAAVEARIGQLAEMYGREKGKPCTPDRMMADLNVYPAAFRDEIRRELCVFELLKARGKLAADARLSDAPAAHAIRAFLKELRGRAEVVTEPGKLAAGEALKIGGRSVSARDFRDFALRSAGPPGPQQIGAAVAALKGIWLAENEMRRLGLQLEDRDLQTHLDLVGRRLQAETGAADPRKAVEIYLASKGSSPAKLMRSPMFRFDAAITKLARNALTDEAIEQEFRRNPGRYGESDVRFGHLFVAVTDEEGRWFQPKDRKTGLPSVDKAIEERRTKAFESARASIEKLKLPAAADWDGTVARDSEDRRTAGNRGQWGEYVNARTLCEPPVDAGVIRAAMKAKVNEVVGPVESAFGWHLIKVFETRQASFEKVKDLVAAGAVDRARGTVFQSLQAKARIE